MDQTFWVIILTNPVVVSGILGAIATAVGWFGNWLRNYLNEKLGKEKFEQAVKMAEIIVTGVEQIAKNAGWDSTTKYIEAMTRLRLWGEQRGIKYTDEQWRMIIERSVYISTKAWEDFKNPPTAP